MSQHRPPQGRPGDPARRAVSAPAAGSPAAEAFEAPPGAEGVRNARVRAQAWLARECGTEVAENAALVIAELLANAHQHGAPPVFVSLRRGDHDVRIEVQDASPHWPVVGIASPDNMTGRGLAVVEAVGASWGVDHEVGIGKTVWAELSEDAESETFNAMELHQLLTGDGGGGFADDRHTVVLGEVPTALLVEAKSHVDNLVRELSLAAESANPGGVAVPDHLASLMASVVEGFGEARDAIKRQAVAAAQRGEPRTSLRLHLPLSAARAGEEYLAALGEIDGYARAARLLTLETPFDHRLFRRWYVEAVIEQLRARARGETPAPTRPFMDVVLVELRRMAAAQRVGDQSARMQRVTAALARARTPEDVAAVVISEAVEALGASGGGLLVPAPDGEHLLVPGAVGYGERLVEQLREERADAPLPGATALRTGNAIWLETQAQRDAQFPEMRGFEPATKAICAVPLVVGQRIIGAMRFSFDTVKLFDESERDFVLALAAQTAQTLQRTELYEAERQSALELQRALLPQALTVASGWDVAAFYSPAGGHQIGGDFYDLIPLADGRVAAVVGDVMGRGLQAAAAMAEVRSVIRAYAVDNPDPATVFRRVDAFFNAFDSEQLVTAVYFLVDAVAGTVQVANAGHLPLLLAGPGRSALVPTVGALPFGAGGDERSNRTITLEPGEALIAITDGLVERRNEDIDVGVRRLLDRVAGISWRTSQTLVARIVGAVPGVGLGVTQGVGLGGGQGTGGEEDAMEDGVGEQDDVTVLALARR